MKNGRTWFGIVIAAAGLTAMVFACSSSGDAASAADTGPCPATPTYNVLGCSGALNFPVCEYGDPHCPVALGCNGNVSAPYVAGARSCGDANAPSCPSSFSAAPGSASCDELSTCTYPEGRCACVPCLRVDVDGEAVDAGTEWTCAPWVTPSGCPVTEPLAGAPCSIEGQTCDYGWSACSVLVLGDLLTCTQGYWSASAEGTGFDCAGDASPPACGH